MSHVPFDIKLIKPKKMRVKTFLIALAAIVTLINQSGAATLSGNIEPDTLKIYAHSGLNQVMIPLAGGLPSDNPDISANTDTTLLSVEKFDYLQGSSFILVTIREKGKSGVARLDVTLSFGNQKIEATRHISIEDYHNPGLFFQVHDIIFWQEAVPLNNTPVYETITSNSLGPWSKLNYSIIPLTVNQDCDNPAICTGHDFYTAFYKGYLVPPADGTYHLYMQSSDNHALWFSETENHNDAKIIIARSSKHGKTGTEIGNGRTKSAALELKAGKKYAFYATQWIIHSTTGGILWDGPGINMSVIQGQHLMPVYDLEKPEAPGNLALEWASSTELKLKWNSSSDNDEVTGYQIYLNGIQAKTLPASGNEASLTGLQPDTRYDIAMTATDRSGNVSFFSDVISVTTGKTDITPPYPPDSLQVIQETGLAMHLKWFGAFDNETEIIGYNIFVNGELYNTAGFFASDQMIIHNLMPETTYTIEIEALDAGLNVSAKSTPFEARTSGFDPLGPTLGERKAELNFWMTNTSWSEGIGLNGPYENGDMVNHPVISQLVRDFKPGAIRWGAIPANSKSLQQSSGPGKENTYARMLSMANEMDAWFALTAGVQDGLDYRTDPETFLHLLEYLEGDSSTTWGAIRASEGFKEPLLGKGKGILLEFGNEVWGAQAHDANIGADYFKYAQWVREMSDIIKTSPYYDPEKIILVTSGRNPHPDASYWVNTRALTGDKGHVDCLAVSGYLGGNLNYDPDIPAGNSELDYYKNGLEMAAKNMVGFVLTMKEMVQLTGTVKTFYLYESNMTTQAYNGRFGQAVIMTDYLANSMNYGSIVPSLFHLTGGEWRITRPAENYRELPLYTLGKYFNRFCKGHILRNELITNDTISNSSGKKISYSPVGSYVYNQGENFSILLVNRDFENNFTVSLNLPDVHGLHSEATLYTFSSSDYSSYSTVVDSVTVNLHDNMLVQIPAFGMAIISVKGEDPAFDRLPMGHYDRQLPESMNIYMKNGGNIGVSLGSEVITANISPYNAFNPAVTFKVLENPTESTFRQVSGNSLQIFGSGICGDAGIIKVAVIVNDNPAISDTISVNVTAQGSGCPTTSLGETPYNNHPLFYPNPAGQKITFSSMLGSDTRIQIINPTGQIVLKGDLTSGYELGIGSIDSGLYVVSIILPKGDSYSEKLVIN